MCNNAEQSYIAPGEHSFGTFLAARLLLQLKNPLSAFGVHSSLILTQGEQEGIEERLASRHV